MRKMTKAFFAWKYLRQTLSDGFGLTYMSVRICDCTVILRAEGNNYSRGEAEAEMGVLRILDEEQITIPLRSLCQGMTISYFTLAKMIWYRA